MRQKNSDDVTPGLDEAVMVKDDPTAQVGYWNCLKLSRVKKTKNINKKKLVFLGRAVAQASSFGSVRCLVFGVVRCLSGYIENEHGHLRPCRHFFYWFHFRLYDLWRKREYLIINLSIYNSGRIMCLQDTKIYHRSPKA